MQILRQSFRPEFINRIDEIIVFRAWETLEEWAGTCREVVVTRDDGRQHRAFFSFL